MIKFLKKCYEWVEKNAPSNWALISFTLMLYLVLNIPWEEVYAYFGLYPPGEKPEQSDKFYENLYGFLDFLVLILMGNLSAGSSIWLRGKLMKNRVELEVAEKWLRNGKKNFWRMPLYLIIIIIAIYLTLYFRESIIDLLGLSKDFKGEIGSGQFYRNRGFAFAGVLGAIFTILGISLTTWGRIQTRKQIELKQKVNTSERYENAAHMLGNSILPVRAAGCHALRDLGSIDENNWEIANRCVNLLLTYISNPYIIDDEKIKLAQRKLARRTTFSEDLEYLFPSDDFLRADIQAAIDSLNAICRYHYDKFQSIILNNMDLPSYFWKNQHKGNMFLPNLRVSTAKLRNAHLRFANLREANLESIELQNADLNIVNLQRAKLAKANLKGVELLGSNLRDSDLSGAQLQDADLYSADLLRATIIDADLSNADMREIAHLTKEQIRSAKWTQCPLLSMRLLMDEEIQSWLKGPYNKSKEELKKEAKIEKAKAKEAKAKAKKA